MANAAADDLRGVFLCAAVYLLLIPLKRTDHVDSSGSADFDSEKRIPSVLHGLTIYFHPPSQMSTRPIASTEH